MRALKKILYKLWEDKWSNQNNNELQSFVHTINSRASRNHQFGTKQSYEEACTESIFITK